MGYSYRGLYKVIIIVVTNGDARSLDHSSNAIILLEPSDRWQRAPQVA